MDKEEIPKVNELGYYKSYEDFEKAKILETIKRNSKTRDMEVVSRKKFGDDLVVVVFRRIPLNKKPNWIWWAWRCYYGWQGLPLSESQLNNLPNVIKESLKWCNLNEVNKKLHKSFKCEKEQMSLENWKEGDKK